MVVIGEDLGPRAIAEKNIGNSNYKTKEFEKALESYNRAIELDPTNISFYTNKAAVFFEQGEHERCRETCLKAVDIGRTYESDGKLIAKAYGRIGKSFMKQKNYEDAREFFDKSLHENQTPDITEKLILCEKEIKEQERLAYINPDVSKEEKSKADTAFRAGKFQSSLKYYSEAIKRNPDDARLYLDRATVYMKLSMSEEALADCEWSVKKDPSFVKGYICKGAVQESLENYNGAMDSYTKALDLDPNTKEATEAYFRCLDKDYQHRNNPASVYSRAIQNPEMKEVFPDPAFKRLIREINHDPSAIATHLNDPLMMESLRNLVKYDLVKL